PHETLDRSAQRETLEETGLDISLGQLALLSYDSDWCSDDPTVPYLMFAYHANPVDATPDMIRLNPEEHTDYQLVYPDEAEQLAITSDSRRALGYYCTWLDSHARQQAMNRAEAALHRQ